MPSAFKTHCVYFVASYTESVSGRVTIDMRMTFFRIYQIERDRWISVQQEKGVDMYNICLLF